MVLEKEFYTIRKEFLEDYLDWKSNRVHKKDF